MQKMEQLRNKYLKELGQISDLTLVVLKGHLLIEELLNEIIDLSFPNHDKLSMINLSFYQKVVITNSLCWKKPDDEIWNFIFCLNTLRNDLAHNLESAKRNGKLDNVLKKHLELYEDEETRKETKSFPTEKQIVLAIGIVLGFLHNFKSDVKMKYNFFHLMLKSEDKILKKLE